MPQTNASRCSLHKLLEGIVKMAYASHESKWAVSMNAIEIEEQVSALTELPFDPDEFSYAFLAAFGNKSTTIKRLRAGASYKSTN